MIDIELAWEHDSQPTAETSRLCSAARAILEEEGIQRARISLAVVDDPTIHAMNRQYLNHDYATDVLSFPLERQEDWLEGEVVVSLDTARRVAAEVGWRSEDELLLYVVHGVLHLVGYDDKDPDARQDMRSQERRHLARFGLQPPSEPTSRTTKADDSGDAANSPGDSRGGELSSGVRAARDAAGTKASAGTRASAGTEDAIGTESQAGEHGRDAASSDDFSGSAAPGSCSSDERGGAAKSQ